jgi:hypothetical protein
VLVDIAPAIRQVACEIVSCKGALDDKDLLDFIDAPAALWSATDEAVKATCFG